MTKQEALIEYALRLGDTSLILGHRLSEWCGHGPLLEEDIAMTNISLDLIGQSRQMFSYAAQLEDKGHDEDYMAFHRDARQYRNLMMAEQPNGDYAVTTARQFLMSAYLVYLYEELKNSKDENIRAFAEKSLKEVLYHLRHSADWMLRLGDGTEESNQRLQVALEDLWFFTDDLFDADAVDDFLLKEGIAADLTKVKNKWNETINKVITDAKLKMPQPLTGFMRKGSRKGNHTEYLGHLLADMQFLPRAYPGTKW
ncbi:MAG: 1,2-phenylacetyl-CoA epoxidase subunit PaaC [Bacteroidia bacterium]